MNTNCPYCNSDIEINHDDDYGYEENVKHQQECGRCGKNFTFTTSILFHYETEKADCLNGGDHEYRKTITIPEEFSKMQCSICDDIRAMTIEERESFGINTIQSYMSKIKK